jgi:putative ABC transport system permease protein
MGRWLDRLRLRMRSLFHGREVDRRLSRELEFHLQQQVQENLDAGMSPGDARAAAYRAFGPVASIEEACRETRRVAWVENASRDLRYSLRALARQPLLVAAATASIAVGVSANTTVFSLASEFLMRPPTAARPDRLMYIRMSGNSHVSHAQWQALQETRALAGVAGYQIEREVNWRAGDRSVTLIPLIVTSNYFELLGVPVAMGRGFTAAEAAADRDPRVAVISHGFWQRQLGADPAIVGRPLQLNGDTYTIVGVLPASLRAFPGYSVAPEVYLPVSRSLMSDLDDPLASVVQLVGRLQDGQTMGQGRAALETAGKILAADRGWRTFGSVGQFAPLTEGPGEFQGVTAFFTMLLIVVGLVLAIACANVTGLLLARGTTRRRELAVRAALGAGRGRLIQQMLAESFWLAVFGTVCGLLLSLLLLGAVSRIPLPLPLPIEIRAPIDARLLLYLAGLVIAATFLSGLPPALHATRRQLLPAVKQDEPRIGWRRWSLRALLVVGQVAVSAVLLVTASLFLRNLMRTNATDPGFDTRSTIVAQVGFVEGRHTRDGLTALLGEAVERLRSTPGIAGAAVAHGIPLTIRSGRTTGTEIGIAGTSEQFAARYESNAVGPGYFSTMGIRVTRGRDFGAGDTVGAPLVVVVNEEFVRRHLAGREPVGTTLMLPGPGAPQPGTIVGVVSNSKHRMLGETQQAAIYSAWLQAGNPGRLTHVIVRAASPDAVEGVKSAVETTIGALDPTAAVQAQAMSAALAFAFLPSQVGAGLLGSLGTLALVLAAAGLFAMVSYAVTRRTIEIGIRLALGAPRRTVARLVVRESAVLVLVGLAIGLGAASLLTSSLTTFLVSDLSPGDPVSFAGTAVLFAIVTLAASIGPVRRAMRVEPAIALRAE